MAHNNKQQKRQWGTGSIKIRKLADGTEVREIHWWEWVIVDGKKKRKHRSEALRDTSERKADRAVLSRIEESRKTVVRQKKDIPTFAEHVDRCERDIVPLYKYSTKKGQRSILRKHFLPQFGSCPLPEITPKDVQAFFTTLYGRYTLSSLRDFREVFRRVLQVAVDWKIIDHNPGAGIKLPTSELHRVVKPPRETPTMSRQQAGQLISAIRPVKPRVMVSLALATGMRRGELVALRWKHLDDSTGVLTVEQAAVDGVIDTTKSRHKKTLQRIPLDRPTVDTLLWWRGRSKHSAPDDFLFPNRDGAVMKNPDNILKRHVYPACRSLGLPQMAWHGFRRSVITDLHEKHTDARTIADISGQASLDTQAIYIQSREDAKKEAIRRLNEELHRFCTDPGQMRISFDVQNEYVN